MGTRTTWWMVRPAILLVAVCCGCAGPTRSADPGHTPRVLIIGDSISISYFEPTKQLLAGTAEVYHNAGNAQHTRYGLNQIDTWLDDTAWDLIHFNFGLHDLKYINAKGALVTPAEGRQVMSADEYARNLEQIVRRLKQTHAKLIFATTTPVPEGSAGRIQGDAARYNAAALPIMKRYGVQVDDLYAFALPRLATIQRPHNVHFTPEGSQLLAEQVANSIRAALAVR